MAKSTHARTTARDFFSHLLAISMLYAGVISLLTLLFQYINVTFPDPLDYYLGSLELIRNSMATLIVVWPVYLLMSWLIRKDMKKHPEKAGIWVRTWLMYLTLFVSAVTIIVDLVTLIYNFLGGELTIRFGLKVLVVLLVAAAVFSYYLWDLKEDGALKSSLPKHAGSASVVVAVAVIVLGFVIAGTPSQQRDIRLDEERVQDLSRIQSEIISYWQQKEELPDSLEALENEITGFSAPTDPITETAYTYRATGDLSFELCAIFAAESKDDLSRNRYDYYPGVTGSWEHGAGEVCFDRTIDPELYTKPGLVR